VCVSSRSEAGRTLVVSALSRGGAAQSPEWIGALAAAASGSGGGGAEARIPGFESVAMSVLGQMDSLEPTVTNAQGYFRYLGSETAPPCQEGVTWIVLKYPLPITSEHLRSISGAMGPNVRPVQPVNGRDVLDSHMV